MAERKVGVPVVLVGRPWDEDDIYVRTRTPVVQVGTPWSGDDLSGVVCEEAKQRLRVAVGLTVFFAVLAGVFSVYAIATRDTPLVNHIMGFVGSGLLAGAAWACGVPLVESVRERKARKHND